jgi:alpha-glucuronidase
VDRCPDNLLLFFHHVVYTHVLHSGKTVAQHIYDSHYEGVEGAQAFITEWKPLDGRIDEERYRDILTRFEYQAGEALVWRDAICNWMFNLSHIADDKGRFQPLADKKL